MAAFLDDREKLFEEKFLIDRELEFKVKSRRNYLFGLWSARQINLSDDAAETYARSLVDLLLENPDEDVLLNRVYVDLKNVNQPFSLLQLKKQLGYAYEDARKKLING